MQEFSERPDPGVSVQIVSVAEGIPPRLYFARQVRPDNTSATLPGAIVCDCLFVESGLPPIEWTMWSLDYLSFDGFVRMVERDPMFSDLLSRRVESSSVTWEPDDPLADEEL